MVCSKVNTKLMNNILSAKELIIYQIIKSDGQSVPAKTGQCDSFFSHSGHMWKKRRL